jgi:hypothetical protein
MRVSIMAFAPADEKQGSKIDDALGLDPVEDAAELDLAGPEGIMMPPPIRPSLAHAGFAVSRPEVAIRPVGHQDRGRPGP